MPEVPETFKRLKDNPQGESQHLHLLLETFLMPLSQQLDNPAEGMHPLFVISDL